MTTLNQESAAERANNYVFLQGNLETDVTLKKSKNDIPYASFLISTADNFSNDKGEEVEVNDFHRLMAWGKMAHVVKDLKKGDEVKVKGMLKTGRSTDEKGKKSYFSSIKINKIQRPER